MKIIFDSFGRPHPVLPRGEAAANDLMYADGVKKKEFFITGEIQEALTSAVKASEGSKSEGEIIRDALRSYLQISGSDDKFTNPWEVPD